MINNIYDLASGSFNGITISILQYERKTGCFDSLQIMRTSTLIYLHLPMDIYYKTIDRYNLINILYNKELHHSFFVHE
jgi:hypothetical protein